MGEFLIPDARHGMARHVAEQSLAWQRGVAQDRIALLTKEAAHYHNDIDLVDALGNAAANAARAHSRVGDGPPGGEAEDAAAATARSGVLGAAIQAMLDRGDTAGANALFAAGAGSARSRERITATSADRQRAALRRGESQCAGRRCG